MFLLCYIPIYITLLYIVPITREIGKNPMLSQHLNLDTYFGNIGVNYSNIQPVFSCLVLQKQTFFV